MESSLTTKVSQEIPYELLENLPTKLYGEKGVFYFQFLTNGILDDQRKLRKRAREALHEHYPKWVVSYNHITFKHVCVFSTTAEVRPWDEIVASQKTYACIEVSPYKEPESLCSKVFWNGFFIYFWTSMGFLFGFGFCLIIAIIVK